MKIIHAGSLAALWMNYVYDTKTGSTPVYMLYSLYIVTIIIIYVKQLITKTKGDGRNE